MRRRVWQSLQMQGGLRGSVQSKGWAGEGSWQEEIPQKKLGSNTNGRITKPCSAAGSDNQATAFSSRPPSPEAEVTVSATSSSVSLNNRTGDVTAACNLSQSHMSAELPDVDSKLGESHTRLAWKLPSIFEWEMLKYAALWRNYSSFWVVFILHHYNGTQRT